MLWRATFRLKADLPSMSALAATAPPNWIAALAGPGWAVLHDVVPPELVAALAGEAARHHEADRLEPAGVGRAGDHALDRSIRRDKTRWLSRASEAEVAYLAVMEAVRLEVNRSLLMGLFSYEAHFAAYEPGGFYARHVDAFRGQRNRLLSSVLYLNTGWGEGDGGELAVFAPEAEEDAEPVALIAPEAGTLVLFLSEDIPHEVRPARRTRYSIAGWYRVNDRAVVPALQVPVSQPVQ